MVVAICRVCSNPFAIGHGDSAFTVSPDPESGYLGNRCPECRGLATRRIASREIARARAAISCELLRKE